MEDHDSALLRFLRRHPDLPMLWLFAVAEIYLLSQAIPGLLDPASRWGYALFLGPFHLALLFLMRAMWKLSRAVRMFEGRASVPAETASPDPAGDLVEAAGGRSWHLPQDCPGPGQARADVDPPFWTDTCGAAWRRRHDGAWVQLPLAGDLEDQLP